MLGSGQAGPMGRAHLLRRQVGGDPARNGTHMDGNPTRTGTHVSGTHVTRNTEDASTMRVEK